MKQILYKNRYTSNSWLTVTNNPMHIIFYEVVFNTHCILLSTHTALKLQNSGQYLEVHDHSRYMQSALAFFSTSFPLTTLSHRGNIICINFPGKTKTFFCVLECVFGVYICNQAVCLSGAWHVRRVSLCCVVVVKCFVLLELCAEAGRQLCSHTLTLLPKPDSRAARLSLT